MRRFSEREQGLLLFLAVVILLTVMVQGGMSFQAARAEAHERIQKRERELTNLKTAIADVKRLQSASSTWTAVLANEAPLGTFLEQSATEAGLGSRIVSIASQPAESNELLQFEPVRLRMRGLTLEQAVNFMYLVESRRSDLQMREIVITSDPSDPGRLQLNLLVVRALLAGKGTKDVVKGANK